MKLDRVKLARRLGLRAVPLRCINSGRSYVRLSCRCGRHTLLGIPLFGPTGVDHLLGMLDCPCIPPLRECVSPEELRQLLMSLPLDALHELRDALLPPETKSPRQEPTDEGLVLGTERCTAETYKKNDSSAGIASQSRILPESQELTRALHGEACSGHQPPTGDAA